MISFNFIKRSILLPSLVKAMLAIDAEQDLSTLIDHVLKRKKRYKLIKTHLVALYRLEPQLVKSSSVSLSHWLSSCHQQLKKRTAKAPEKPADYQREATLSCSCADCQMLSAFLANPTQSQGRFPLAQQRRKHLHQIINTNHCDLTHETERVGRPFTLVCTKTTVAYTEATKIYERDLKHLSRIVKIQQQQEGN